MTRRVLHVVRSLQRETGGIAEAVRQLVPAQANRGDTVSIASLDPRDTDVGREFARCAAISVHSFGRGRSARDYGFSPAFVPWLRRTAAEYDAVIVHGLWQYHAFGTWRALHGGSTPYVVLPHGMLDVWFKRRYPLKHAKKWLYWPWGDYRVLRDAAAVCYTTEIERQRARSSFWLYRANETIVPIGIKDPAAELSDPGRFFSEFPRLRERPFLLFLGRIHPKKGIDLLVHAFARVYCDDPAKPLLVIAGPVDDAAYLGRIQAAVANRGIRDEVVWLPMLSGSRKWAALRGCEAFVLCSHQENFGVAVVEALACSRPVLISDQVAIHREIETAGAGLVASDTTDGAERLLGRWRNTSAAERKAMRTSARVLFAERFEVQRSADILDGVIQACLRGPA